VNTIKPNQAVTVQKTKQVKLVVLRLLDELDELDRSYVV
jgi:hypothetical protein